MEKYVSSQYDKPTKTSLHLKHLARQYLTSLEKRVQEKPREVLECWAKIVQAPYASLTRAIKFEDGVLHVAVRHSTLLSILHSPPEKERLLKALLRQVPDAKIRDIVFRIG
jgi:hypothetical protein